MKDKQRLKYEIENKKNELKQKQSSIESVKAELDKLEKDYHRAGPRMFLIREMEQPSIIAGSWNPFVITEVFSEPNMLSLGPNDIFVKEVTK